jgi:hypothetical protein
MSLHAQRFYTRLTTILAFGLMLSAPLFGQNVDSSEIKPATIVGTVSDVNGDTVAEATVALEGADPSDRRTATSNENGYFEFHDLKPGTPYHLQVTAEGFSDWNSPVVTLEPSQFKIISDIRLQVQLAQTTMIVTQTVEEVATEQVQVEEKQRVLGIIPNFYVVYDPDPVPLTTKLKFRLAFKVATDPVTGLGIAFLSGVQQAGDMPDYGQGLQGFGKRVGANSADGFTDIMIGGAILPSLLHQDPRYFYQGTGTKKSRIEHAVFHPFVCKGDNGKMQPNFSSLGGDLASSAISNLYYPQSNRGLGLVFTNFGISTAERVATSLVQEFVLRPLMSHPR